MTQVYYNNKNNKKKQKTGSSPHQSISNLGSARISGLKVGDNLSESYVPSQHSYVMQRESMIFKTIPNRNNEEEKKEFNYKRRI